MLHGKDLWGILGTCLTCWKTSFTSRKKARKYASRRYGRDRMNAYQCPANSAYWHLGHKPDALRQGRISRAEYRSNIKPKEAR